MKKIIFSLILAFIMTTPVWAEDSQLGGLIVVKSLGCKVYKTPSEQAEVALELERKDYVNVKNTQDDWVEISKESIDDSPDITGWAKAACFMSMGEFFKDPVCSAKAWVDSGPVTLAADLPDARIKLVRKGKGGYYQVQVLNKAEETLWLGPTEEDIKEDQGDRAPFFFCGAEGDFWPLPLMDLDADGNVEMINLASHSDASGPIQITVSKWNGKAMEEVVSEKILIETEPGSNVFSFAKLKDFPTGRWLYKPLKVNSAGGIIWEIRETKKYNLEKAGEVEAVLSFKDARATLKGKPVLKKIEE